MLILQYLLNCTNTMYKGYDDYIKLSRMFKSSGLIKIIVVIVYYFLLHKM